LFASREEDASICFATDTRLDKFQEARITDRSAVVDAYSFRLPSNVRGGDTIEMLHHFEPRFVGRPPSESAGILWMYCISELFEKWAPPVSDPSNICMNIVTQLFSLINQTFVPTTQRESRSPT
jgi:hypothetical protein